MSIHSRDIMAKARERYGRVQRSQEYEFRACEHFRYRGVD